MSIFLQAFVFIFLAALPGKTTFIMIVMAARNKHWPIFIGSLLAFLAQAFISVELGHLLAFIPAFLLPWGLALLLFFFAVRFWQESKEKDYLENSSLTKHMSAGTAFLLIFSAEW